MQSADPPLPSRGMAAIHPLINASPPPTSARSFISSQAQFRRTLTSDLDKLFYPPPPLRTLSNLSHFFGLYLLGDN